MFHDPIATALPTIEAVTVPNARLDMTWLLGPTAAETRQAVLLLAYAGLCACAGGSSAERSPVAAGGTGTAISAGVGGAIPGIGGRGGMQISEGGAHASGAGGQAGGSSGTGAAGVAGEPPASDAGAQTMSGGDAGVAPIERDGKYALELGELYFEVDPQLGGRITRFALGGRDVLTTTAVHAENWGSTFWPSPQSWGWPPPVEIDRAPYQARIDGDAIVLEGAVSAAVGLRVSKRFRADAERQAIVAEFVLHNAANIAASWAPWQISRVPAGGLTFFPTGSRLGPRTELAVQDLAGVSWYAHDFTAITLADGQKHVADGAEGWLAHASDGLLFVKSFADVPAADQHASEGEIEIYANHATDAARAYVEIECQGPLTSIPAGGMLAWNVTWYLRELPLDAAIEPGSQALAAFARSVVTGR